MKTAEEILKEKQKYTDLETGELDYYMADVISAMQEYAKQEAEKFVEYSADYIFSADNLWYKDSDGNPKNGITTAELYEEYLKSKQH